MNLDISTWDLLLASALTVPGIPNPEKLSRDDVAFVWGRWNTPEWSTEQACARLGVERLEFPARWIQVLDGFAVGNCISLNPRATFKVRVAAHELAHVVLKHTMVESAATRKPIEEFEADCVAIVVCHALGLEAAIADCRSYIQSFVKHPCTGPLPQSWDPIKRAARMIIAAGAGRFTVIPEPPPLAVQTLDTFRSRIRW